jgi:hypothetical protein
MQEALPLRRNRGGMSGAAHAIDRYRCLSCRQNPISCPFIAPFGASPAMDAVMDALGSDSGIAAGISATAVMVAGDEEFSPAPGYPMAKSPHAAKMRSGFAAGSTFRQRQALLILEKRACLGCMAAVPPGVSCWDQPPSKTGDSILA